MTTTPRPTSAASRPSEISLLEAADQLGVHYMTAYRYVRTGRLAAHKQGAQWQVAQSDLDRFGQPEAPPRRARADHTARLVARLLVGDESGSWTVAQRALSGGLEPAGLYLDVLGPAMREIGDRWAAGEATVAEEHQASMVMSRLMGRLGPLFNRSGRSRGSVVLGAPQGDRHSLPTSLLADLLRGQGLAVVQLGSDLPPESFVEAAGGAERLAAVGISTTLSGNEDAVAATVDALHRAGIGPVVVGGRVLASAQDPDQLAARLGADHHAASAPDALELFGALADEATRERRRSRRTAHPPAAGPGRTDR